MLRAVKTESDGSGTVDAWPVDGFLNKRLHKVLRPSVISVFVASLYKPDKMSYREMAKHLHMSEMYARVILRMLEQEGYISKRKLGRYMVIRATARGQRLYQAYTVLVGATNGKV